LNTSYHISNGLFVSILCYIGHRHRPKTIGFGILVLGLGVFTTSLPHYIVGPYISTEKQENNAFGANLYNSTLKTCNPEAISNNTYLAIFILAYFLMGIGNSPIYSLGIAHIDEITNRGKNVIYTSTFFVFSAFGPALGYMAAKPILSIYVDMKQPEGVSITPEDNNWVGAWWLGFLIGAILLLLPVIPMLGFPRLFPDADILKEKKKELEDTVEEDEQLKHDFKSIWPATKALFKNKPFIFICLASASESLAVGGFSTFMPKFVETQFHFTASNASFVTGLIVIPGVAGGIFTGGYLVKRLNWTCKSTLRGSALFALIATLMVSFVFVGCSGRDVVGSTIPYKKESTNSLSLINECNKNCHCNNEYKPICIKDDQLTYFSPCYAGCNEETSKKEYQNCSCFPSNTTIAIDGRCTPDCKLFPLFAFGAFLLFFFTFLNNVPMINATFRVVPEGQGSFAMGFQQVFVRFLGFIPAPTLFGSLIDKSCKLWNHDECTNDTTNCAEYDNPKFRYYIFVLGVITKFLSFVFIFLAYKFYKLPAKSDSMKNEDQLNGHTLQGLTNMEEQYNDDPTA